MGYIVPDVGERELLERALTSGLYVALFTNNHTPSSSTVRSDLTECSDMNYTSDGRKSLSFSSATTTGGKAVKSASSAVSWTFSPDIMEMRTPFTVYGYFVVFDSSTGETSSPVIMVERFSSPFYIDAATSQAVSVGGPFKVRLYDPNS